MAIESKLNRGPVGYPLGQPDKPKQSKSWLWIIGILIIIAVVAVWWYRFYANSSQNNEPISLGDYQAIFLDNGQVYFGRLNSAKGDFLTLIDIFYLQTGAVGLDQTSNMSLTKLGNEAHGPEDKMKINKEHILFIENMKSDSKVVQAINEYQSKKKQSN